MKTITWLCGTAAALSLLIPFWLLVMPSGGILSFDSPIPQAGRVLLVTAHPDDETIFFSPTISALRHAGNEVFLLCFTNGNYHGLGQVRQQELLTAAAALQVEADHVKVIDHENIQDGHHTDWDEQEMLRILTAETRANAINTIVTFDEAGVYGHKNHKACFDAVREFLYSCKSLPDPGLPQDPAAALLQEANRGPRRLEANPQGPQASQGAPVLTQPGSSLSAANSIMADARLPRGSRFTSLGKRGHVAARTAGVQYPSSGAESAAEAGDKGSSPQAGSGRKVGRQLDEQRVVGAYRGRRLRAGRLAARAQAAAWHKISAGEPRSGRKLAATGRLQAASSSSHAGLRLEAGRGCPKAYQLLTVSKLRKYASMLDVLPSALEGKLHLVTYVNRSIAATFTAMSAHNSQWRWWVHVLTTRYTFVNTLQLLGPDPRLDRQTALKLAQQEAAHVAAAGAAPADAAELDRQTIASITGGNR